MDGKYAKYIQNFMKSFKINGDKVEIQTIINEKDKPLTYNLTKETIEDCNKKLATQYKIITDNEEEIQNNLTRKTEIFTALFGIIFILSLIAVFAIPTTEITLALILKATALLSASITILGSLTLGTERIRFMNLVHIVKDYKKNRKDIEEAMKKDENITKYLSEDTQELLTEKTKLLASGKNSEILDIDFMDKLLDKKTKGRKELINLLTMYKATISLKEEPKYVSPQEEKITNPKKRSRKKEQNK